MLLPGRDTFDPQYRYGFNGKEKEFDFRGFGQITDYGERIYNARLGKFLSVDPLQKSYPFYTPYQFAGNKPIAYLDLDGLEEYYYSAKWNQKTGKVELKLDKVVNEKSFFGFTYKPSYEVNVKFIQSNSTSNYSFTRSGTLVFNEMGGYQNKSADFEKYRSTVTNQNFSDEQSAYLDFDNRFFSEGALLINRIGSTAQTFYNNGGAYALNARINNQTTRANSGNAEGSESNSASPKGLKVAPYKEAVKENVGMGLNADHIPSFASLRRMREESLGRQLTTQEATALRQSALTLSVEAELHESKSLTFAGRNNASRQTSDAANPLQAIKDNVNAYRPELLKKGYTDADVDAVIINLSKPFQK